MGLSCVRSEAYPVQAIAVFHAAPRLRNLLIEAESFHGTAHLVPPLSTATWKTASSLCVCSNAGTLEMGENPHPVRVCVVGLKRACFSSPRKQPAVAVPLGSVSSQAPLGHSGGKCGGRSAGSAAAPVPSLWPLGLDGLCQACSRRWRDPS